MVFILLATAFSSYYDYLYDYYSYYYYCYYYCCLSLGPACLHLSPGALWMLWALWSAWSRTSLPDVSRYTRDLCPHDFRLVSHLSPGPLWVLLFAWFRTCLPQLSPTTLWVLCPHDFVLFFNLSPSTPCSTSHDFTLVSYPSTLLAWSGCCYQLKLIKWIFQNLTN